MIVQWIKRWLATRRRTMYERGFEYATTELMNSPASLSRLEGYLDEARQFNDWSAFDSGMHTAIGVWRRAEARRFQRAAV